MRGIAGRVSIVVSVALGVGACNSASDWFPSDVDEHAAISAAGPAAAAKVCMAFEDYLLDQYRESLFVEIACTALGIENTETAAACSDYVTDCIDNPPAEVQTLVDTIVAGVGCDAVDYTPMGCSKTISDLRACLEAAEDEVTELKRTVVCAAAGQPLPAGSLTIETPAECLSIENACPLPG
jgi:hypothetical protein